MEYMGKQWSAVAMFSADVHHIGVGKRRESGKLPPSASMDMMMPYQRKATKRPNQGMADNLDHGSFFVPDPKAEIGRPTVRGERKVPLMIKDLSAQEKWFGEAFKAVQQVGCRTIAKNWIKKIHPKKVSRSKVMALTH
jgi:hypothetical protein